MADGKTVVALPGADFARSFALARLEGGTCATVAGAGGSKSDLCEGDAMTATVRQ